MPTYIESKERLSPRGYYWPTTMTKLLSFMRMAALRCGIQKTFDHGIPIVRIPAKVKLDRSTRQIGKPTSQKISTMMLLGS